MTPHLLSRGLILHWDGVWKQQKKAGSKKARKTEEVELTFSHETRTSYLSTPLRAEIQHFYLIEVQSSNCTQTQDFTSFIGII